MVEESSQVSAPAVSGALFFGSGQKKARKEKVSCEVILSIFLLPNSFLN
jgi:hypothetical protein